MPPLDASKYLGRYLFQDITDHQHGHAVEQAQKKPSGVPQLIPGVTSGNDRGALSR